MSFSPKFLVLGAVAVSLLLAVIFLAGQGAQPGARAPAQAAASAPTPQSVPGARNAPAGPAAGSATLDLVLLAKSHNLDEADNVRWSLVRSKPGADGLIDAQTGVKWAVLRTGSTEGSIPLPAGESWSFNDAFGGGTGYKNASGVLAGGQCALATVFRAAAMKAGLATKASPHRTPIPGFPQNETANIWWGTYDLVIRNTSGQDLSMNWSLTPASVTISIK